MDPTLPAQLSAPMFVHGPDVWAIAAMVGLVLATVLGCAAVLLHPAWLRRCLCASRWPHAQRETA